MDGRFADEGRFFDESFRFFDKVLDFRPRKKINAPISPTLTTLATAIPAMAPDDSFFRWAADGVGFIGDEPSSLPGSGSPGDTIYGDFLAASCCLASELEAFYANQICLRLTRRCSYRIDHSYHRIIDARLRGRTVEENRISVIDQKVINWRLFFHQYPVRLGFHLFTHVFRNLFEESEARKEANLIPACSFIREAWLSGFGSGNGVVWREELEFCGKTGQIFCLILIMTHLPHG